MAPCPKRKSTSALRAGEPAAVAKKALTSEDPAPVARVPPVPPTAGPWNEEPTFRASVRVSSRAPIASLLSPASVASCTKAADSSPVAPRSSLPISTSFRCAETRLNCAPSRSSAASRMSSSISSARSFASVNSSSASARASSLSSRSSSAMASATAAFAAASRAGRSSFSVLSEATSACASRSRPRCPRRPVTALIPDMMSLRPDSASPCSLSVSSSRADTASPIPSRMPSATPSESGRPISSRKSDDGDSMPANRLMLPRPIPISRFAFLPIRSPRPMNPSSRPSAMSLLMLPASSTKIPNWASSSRTPSRVLPVADAMRSIDSRTSSGSPIASKAAATSKPASANLNCSSAVIPPSSFTSSRS